MPNKKLRSILIRTILIKNAPKFFYAVCILPLLETKLIAFVSLIHLDVLIINDWATDITINKDIIEKINDLI